MNVLFGSEIHSKCGKKLNDLNVHSFLMVSVSAEKLPVQVYISPKGFLGGAALVLLEGGFARPFD